MLTANQQSSGEYVLQTESYNIIVSYNTTDVSPLCKFLVSAFRYQFRFFVQQVISSLGSNFQSFIQA